MILLAVSLTFPNALVSQQQPRNRFDSLAVSIIVELNQLRRDPPAYARYREALLPHFEGTLMHRPARPGLRTEEGSPAVREAIRVLRRTPATGPLRRSPALSHAARDHVRDQGPIGALNHRGTDSSTPATRMSRYGKWSVTAGESIAVGINPARDGVIQLLVDDGVPNRGHRRALLDRT
ncbi:MAG TPA: CAP domain-containing protein [Gemmatimonadales bacterium]